MIASTRDEELNAQRSDFGLRLKNSMDKYGPLCIGIDPHRALLNSWGYGVNADGAEMFAMRMLQAANGRAAAVKFQLPMFERYGSKGFAALERVLYAARQMGIITIVDCLHGGLTTTISSIADAYFKPGAPLKADAITLLPYYGARSLNNVINDALNNGCGVFIASLTSNEEGASLQTAIRQRGEYKGRTVAYGIAHTAQKHNIGNPGMGSVGLIIGATIGQWIDDSGIDPASFTGPILSPGYGWQGADAADLKQVFEGTSGNVLVTVSRAIASKGPEISALAQATEVVALDVRQALMEAADLQDRAEAESRETVTVVTDKGVDAAEAETAAEAEATADVAPAPVPAAKGETEAETGDSDQAASKGRLIVLSGPTAVGKGTVEAYLRERHPEVWVSVSATTRDPRPGEVDGETYHFVSEEEFLRGEAAGEFLETAVVHGMAHYGTPLKPVLDHLAAGVPTVLEIDLQGARRVRERARELGLEVVFVFIAPPSFEELKRRLAGRGTETAEQQARRLETAKVELAAESEFDIVITNDEVPRAAEELWSVIATEYGL